jgi:hypothetical protein
MEAAVRGFLGRHQSIGIRPISFEIFVHPGRDPACLLRAHDFLRAQSTRVERALVVLDWKGCGSKENAPSLECEIENRLRSSGWSDRARAVVIVPELEIWVWSDSPHVDKVLGWADKQPRLRDWLVIEGYSMQGASKPADPKAAMEAALHVARIPRSSAIYRRLAETVSIERCQDRAFLRLRQIVFDWFRDTDTQVTCSSSSLGTEPDAR